MCRLKLMLAEWCLSSSVGNTRLDEHLSLHLANITICGSDAAVLAGTTRLDRLLAQPANTLTSSVWLRPTPTKHTAHVIKRRLARSGWQAMLEPCCVSDKGSFSGGVGIISRSCFSIQLLPLPSRISLKGAMLDTA